MGAPARARPARAITESSSRTRGSPFASTAFTERVRAARAHCSMDGRGRCLDNVFIERLWRSLKYEAVLKSTARSGRRDQPNHGAWNSHDRRRLLGADVGDGSRRTAVALRTAGNEIHLACPTKPATKSGIPVRPDVR